jgi:SAM-dependent methyltransferase
VDPYVSAFAAFLAATDEKDVLAEALQGELQRQHVQSLLDVGAGSGELGVALSPLVTRYLAIESRDDHVQQLKRLRLNVLHASWPIELEDLFDAVLMSHVLATAPNVAPMLVAALDVLKQRGRLLVVLHAVEGSEWERLAAQLALPHFVRPDLRAVVQDVATRYGARVESLGLKTHVRSREVSQFEKALSFVASADDPALAIRFRERLRESDAAYKCYRTADGEFRFVFDHVLMSIGRP